MLIEFWHWVSFNLFKLLLTLEADNLPGARKSTRAIFLGTQTRLTSLRAYINSSETLNLAILPKKHTLTTR
jgi:hypothetical protein